MKRKKIIPGLIVIVVLTPLWMWLAWLLTPKRKLTVAIIDKTVIDKRGQEHISLSWVLNQRRFAKNRKALYKPEHDYFGFFPGQGDQYKLKGLERFSSDALRRLAGDADAVYFTDTYGIYKQEWFSKVPDNDRSQVLYGGMTQQDIGLLKEMKDRHKLMIAEFNAIGSPTGEPIRHQFEALFGIRWSGWTVRYFPLLDTAVEKELPRWLVDQYRQQHGGAWPFHHDGIAWVNSAGEVEILENGVDLTEPVPQIEARPSGIKALDIPETMKYPFWVDILDSTGANEIMAELVVHVNAKGAALLRRKGLPTRWPAVIRHVGDDYGFYYFSGDFCDNPLSFGTSYFKGIGMIKGFFYDDANLAERKSFFWNFYRPMMTRILEGHYKRLSSSAQSLQ